MHTNIHIHLFSADHTPSAQLYYLFRGALHGAARGLLPALLNRPITTDDLRQLDRSMDRFDWPWPILFDLVLGASPLFTLIDVKRMINMLCTVSRVTRAQARGAFRVGTDETQIDMLTGLVQRTEHHQVNDRPFPFRDAICDLVSELYAAHEAKVGADGHRVTHQDLWDAFMSSEGVDQYKRVIALSMNLDEAFIDDNLPGLTSYPAIDFEGQTAELAQLAANVNAQAGIQILPFLGVDPRGHNAATLDAFVRDRVGKTKPFKGLKIYPPMGLLPTDDRLKPVFDYCQDEGIPVLSHCSSGGAGVRGSNRNFADLAHPLKWEDVLNRLAQRAQTVQTKMFRLCLAHFDQLEAPDSVSWCDELIGLMQRFDGAQKVEVFSDVAFDVITGDARATYGANVARVRALGLADRVLFGSDWWNYLYECDSEKAFIAQLQADGTWWQPTDFDVASYRFLQDVVATD